MKKIFFYVVALCVATGCSDTVVDADLGNATSERECADISLNLELADTRVYIDTYNNYYYISWQTGDVINLYLTEDITYSKSLTYNAGFAGSVYVGESVIAYEFEAGSDTYNGKLVADLSAVTSVEDGEQLPMISDEITVSSESNVTATISVAAAIIQLNMNPANIPTGATLKKIVIDNIPTLLVYDPATGAVTTDVEGATTMTLETPITIGEDLFAVNIPVCPFEVESGDYLDVSFTIEVDGMEYTYDSTINNSTGSTKSIAAGKYSQLFKKVDFSSHFGS